MRLDEGLGHVTAAQRQQVRNAIDAQARERVQMFIVAGELDVCTGCGGDWHATTIGCKRCHDRHLKWALRKDPDFRERARTMQNAARARRRVAA